MNMDPTHASQPPAAISPLSILDVSAMFRIEQLAHSHPWSQKLMASNFGGLYRDLGLWQGDQLLGYVIVRVVAGEAELINIAVDPAHHGQGFGRQLMQAMMALAQQEQWEQILLEVRASNAPAQHLYRTFGFDEIDRRKGYYPSAEGREDALIMRCFCPA
ncbi:ribosomal protein S18-alanine N-acetyltransferase [Ferrimonas pelagia]|uniref:[Ribosomal protein bS18]-alanine N-acetyltransferase n=1 Tax=Ferrimonas pelagia TaxID=1177826 RepID=A0ABP9FHU3_9GAMM